MKMKKRIVKSIKFKGRRITIYDVSWDNGEGGFYAKVGRTEVSSFGSGTISDAVDCAKGFIIESLAAKVGA